MALQKLVIKEIELGKNISIEIDGKEVENVVALDLRLRTDEIPSVVIRQALIDTNIELNNVDIKMTEESDTNINEIIKDDVNNTEIMK